MTVQGMILPWDRPLNMPGRAASLSWLLYSGKMANVDLAVLNDHELDLNTTMMYRHEDYTEAIRLVGEGKIQLKPLMSQHFSFDRYLEAYEYIDRNRETTMKVLIDIDPSGGVTKLKIIGEEYRLKEDPSETRLITSLAVFQRCKAALWIIDKKKGGKNSNSLEICSQVRKR